jgi:hypothetical protein
MRLEKRRRMFHMWDGFTEPVAQVEETPAEKTTVVAATPLSTFIFS